MASPASIARHPIHPMLIVFPIGLWIFSLIADLIYIGTDTAIWNDIAFYTMAGGIVGALLAAIPGLIDYISITNSRTKRIGTIHMVLNVLILGLFIFNLWARYNDLFSTQLPVILSAIGVVMLAVSGWLGGEMVYVRGVGVEPEERIRIEGRDYDTRGNDRDKRRVA
jgi:uncharacterized membrane protein